MIEKKVKVINVTDIDGNVKDERIIGDIRFLTFPYWHGTAFLRYEREMRRGRQTSIVQKCTESNGKIVMETLNTIYYLEVINAEI